MRPFTLKTFFILLVLAGAVCLTTGIDQYIHILVCHHESHCHTDSPGDKPSHHSDSDEQHCPVCQFFTCGQNQTITCDYAEPVTEPVPALQDKLEIISVYLTTDSGCKISRAPPAV